MSEEWGAWIEHDGKGCPCVGQYAHVVSDCGDEFIGIVGSHPQFNVSRYPGGSWNWKNRHLARVLRYRIRKPRGLTILENLIADLPAPVGPKEDA